MTTAADGAAGGAADASRRRLRMHGIKLLTNLRCRWARLWVRGLRWVFHFDPWHASAPYVCRPYKRMVVELANALAPNTAVEIGCGLGEILSRVTATERFGFDADEAVIRAARFLHGGKAHWLHAELAAVAPLLPQKARIDCLIMVNWIHNLSPDDLWRGLLPLLPRTEWLILDAIDRDGPTSYRFKHDFAIFNAVAERVSITCVPGEPRNLVLFKVTR
jgi:SAM-dependent methyltransferase